MAGPRGSPLRSAATLFSGGSLRCRGRGTERLEPAVGRADGRPPHGRSERRPTEDVVHEGLEEEAVMRGDDLRERRGVLREVQSSVSFVIKKQAAATVTAFLMDPRGERPLASEGGGALIAYGRCTNSHSRGGKARTCASSAAVA